ncbi:MAG TPA: UDP-N-acetylmuramoyl-L-alanyl-D-glutamate--2,6-diaminopimelate ligase [Actinomycetota bacterium]|nr:UDP-N-acetylmuramoyl-L-alanyl-D-glutamate--2,6-diaminopimelate ligase [Actinomycetota bacterium]
MDNDIRETTIQSLAASVAGSVLAFDGSPSAAVSGLAYDSRRVRPGDLFFCIQGERADGHNHAHTAAKHGAAALCVMRELDVPLPQIVVSDTRAAMPVISATFLGNPADDLRLLGVTGTNGKTTTAFLLDSIATASGDVTGLVGTIETRVAGVVRPGVRTTPESLDLQLLLRDMKSSGVETVAMEVTSHALRLNRVDAMRFSAAGFTNLSQDHLDFHLDMDDYFEAKRSLFTPEHARRGAINIDDPWGERLLISASIPCLGFGANGRGDVQATGISSDGSGSRFTLHTPDGDADIATHLPGPFNVSNCLAAATIALIGGISLDAIVEGIYGLRAVPGRFESIAAGQAFPVIVDYAHTPDSLENILRAARELVVGEGRLIAVFGCGGDRDRKKRPLMGVAAARLADVLVVTSDNPRSEDPQAILDEITKGVVSERGGPPDAEMVDRRAAIALAVASARPGDVVVIAGKGHEMGQQFATETVPFDDRIVAAEEIQRISTESGSVAR